MKYAVLAACAAGLVASASVNAGVIETFSDWDGWQISALGIGASIETYGQTFSPVAGEETLFNFAFSVDSYSAKPVRLRGYVYEWTGSGTTGAALFRSDPVDVSTTGHEILSFAIPGGVALDAAKDYVAFISVTEHTADNNANNVLALGFLNAPGNPIQNPYAGGTHVRIHSEADTNLWATGSWTFANEDLAFEFQFTDAPDIPVPGGLALAGLLVLPLLRRR